MRKRDRRQRDISFKGSRRKPFPRCYSFFPSHFILLPPIHVSQALNFSLSHSFLFLPFLSLSLFLSFFSFYHFIYLYLSIYLSHTLSPFFPSGHISTEAYYSLSVYDTQKPGQYATRSVSNINDQEIVVEGDGSFEVRKKRTSFN